MPVTHICKQCQQPFTREPSKAGPYCSKPCSNCARALPEVPRFWTHVDKSSSCWLWTAATDKNGYPWFVRRDRKMVYAHRYVYELTYGPLAPGVQVLHKCDNPPCINPEHLFIGTNGDNVADKLNKGRQYCGERHHRAKLTEQDVPDIRQALASHTKVAALAIAYSVSPATIYFITHAQIWRNISTTPVPIG